MGREVRLGQLDVTLLTLDDLQRMIWTCGAMLHGRLETDVTARNSGCGGRRRRHGGGRR